MLQDLLGAFVPALRNTESIPASIFATAVCVGAWGYFLYQGVVDPLGGINTLWPLFGISNQMLAAIALILATVVLFRMKRERYAWVCILPTIWLLICTLTAGLEKVFHSNPSIGFLAHAAKYRDALAAGTPLAPAKSLDQMSQIIFNDYVDAGLAMLFVLVVVSMVIYGIQACRDALRADRPTTHEAPAVLAPAVGD